MDKMIRRALDAAGYTHMPANQESLIDCFLDYADAGYWVNMDYQAAQEQIAAGDITIRDMIIALTGNKKSE